VKTKLSPALVGAFVLGALLLAFVALLSIGGVNPFIKPQRFVVYFNESIEGLELGSPVRLRGVRVGRVVDLSVRTRPGSVEPVVAVTCELNKNTLRDSRGVPLDLTAPGELSSLVARGLRGQLAVASLATGQLFVELDFYNPRTHPAAAPPGPAKYPVVPSVPSLISEFQSNVSEILGKVHQVDFQGLSDDLKALLVSTRSDVDGLDLRALVAQWQASGAAVEALARDPAIPRAVADADAALVQLRATLATLQTQTNARGQDLQATLARTQVALRDFDAAADSVRQILAAQRDLGGNVDRTLSQLSAAADSVRRLADFLERNPETLLTGRAAPP
jgi:phospholipid/cholesterol/gamma-HCH transport system substrate-binding protein